MAEKKRKNDQNEERKIQNIKNECCLRENRQKKVE